MANRNPLIVDEYLNAAGALRVGLRTSLVESPLFILTREQAESLRDELSRALAAPDEKDIQG